MKKNRSKETTSAAGHLRRLADLLDIVESKATTSELWQRAQAEQEAYERELDSLRRRIEVLERKAATLRPKPPPKA